MSVVIHIFWYFTLPDGKKENNLYCIQVFSHQLRQKVMIQQQAFRKFDLLITKII